MLNRSSLRLVLSLAAIAAGSALDAAAAHAAASDDGACRTVAAAQQNACDSDVASDFSLAQAVCRNGPREEQRDCIDSATEERREARAECREQRAARLDLCEELGEGRYAPDFDPDDFDDDFSDPSHPNPYFPLTPGSEWRYEGAETVEVEVRNDTKLIEGVTCIVVRDRVEEDGRVVEDTNDWFAQREDGTVFYCGEETAEFEFFEGDDPERPELVTIDGSFKAGRDGALPGTQFLAAPKVGDVYRQEWSPNNAEDAARVISTTYDFGSNPALDAHVPQALVQLLCDGDCVVTEEFTPLEPDALEHKYYAPGIGFFLQVNVGSGEILQLVSCNVDPRCNSLPDPQ